MQRKLILGAGPKPSPICLVGEAPGLNETIYGRPFVGEAGQELDRMLKDAGLPPLEALYRTNVFKLKPDDTPRANNDIKTFFTSRTASDAVTDLPASTHGYLRSEYREMVAALVPELVGVGARIVVALGATALWALLGHSKIGSYVGTVHGPTAARPFTVLPTYHPSAILHQWSYRTTAVANLGKVAELATRFESTPTKPATFSPLLRVKVNPSLEECRRFADRCDSPKVKAIATDVETAHGQIRTISFAISSTEAFTIPFWEPPAASYWPTIEGELEAWKVVRRIMATGARKIFHNGAYDIQYLWRVHGIPVKGPIDDTMIMHHSMEPELPKSLGALAAVYLKIPEWKTMRLKSEKEEE